MRLGSAPRVLAFDTASPRTHVVLMEGRDVVAELRMSKTETHSTILLSSIHFMLDRLGWTPRDLGLVVAGIGPGSFTGIRIGIATALGIAQPLSIPMAGISSLDALAHQVAATDGRVAVVLDARRSQVFYAEYVCSRGGVRAVQKPKLLSVSDLEHCLAGRHLYIVGDISGFQPARAGEKPSDWPRRIEADLFLADDMGRLALSKKRAWRAGDFLMCEPLYIRPPDALKNRPPKS